MRDWFISALIAVTTCAVEAQVAYLPPISEIPSAPQMQTPDSGGGISGQNIVRRLPISAAYSSDWKGTSAFPAVKSTTEALVGRDALVPTANADSTVTQWRNFARSVNREESPGTRYKASSFVLLDSWIYAAYDRLAAMGYLPTSSATIRPWTRLECARLLAEAHSDTEDMDEGAVPLLAALDQEFAHETTIIDGAKNVGARVESVYGRYTGIAGTPLRDSIHFAQSLTDDFGRPYGKGENGITGVSADAEAGLFAFAIRGEYQYASAIPKYNQLAMQSLGNFDGMPFGWNLRFGDTDRIHLLEAYIAVNLANWQISLGQQSLWWGPDRSTSLIFSNNAEAMPMLRFARVMPAKMPGILGRLGPVHFDAFMARQGGVHYVGLGPNFTLYGSASQSLKPPPYVWGVNFSFKPTANFELGFAHTVIFAGYGRPLNLATFLHSFSILGNGQAVDPGKRVTEFNVTYHLPGFRRNLVVYTEEMAWDDPAEGKYLARFAMDPGIYIPRIPWIKNLDLRAEGVYTNLPGLTYPAYFYGNAHYPQGYTNFGQIFGSWIGKQGSGGQASSTYWFNGRTKAAVTYRRMLVDKSILNGGNLNDISGNMIWTAKNGTEFSAMGQYEMWKFPMLGSEASSNFTTSLEIRVFPKKLKLPR